MWRSSDIVVLVCSTEGQHPFTAGGHGATGLNVGYYDHPECVRGLQGKSGSNEQGADWTNIAHFLLSFSKSSNTGAKAKRLTFEPQILLTEICQRGLKGHNCPHSSAFVVSPLAAVISAKGIHLKRSALH